MSPGSPERGRGVRSRGRLGLPMTPRGFQRRLSILAAACALVGCRHKNARPLPTLADYTHGASAFVEALTRAAFSDDRAALERLVEPEASATEASIPAASVFGSPSGLKVLPWK